MSEPDSAQNQEWVSITPDEFVRFQNSRKGMTARCPICENSQWHIISTTKPAQWSLIGMPLEGGMPLSPESLPLLFLGCSNCFFVRCHAYKPIREWLDNNPSNPESSQETD